MPPIRARALSAGGELVDAKSIKEGKFEAIAERAKQYPAVVAKTRAEMGT